MLSRRQKFSGTTRYSIFDRGGRDQEGSIGGGRKKQAIDQYYYSALSTPGFSRNARRSRYQSCNAKPGRGAPSLPSKVFNVMASARPILAVAPPESELAQIVKRAGCGWIVHRDSPGSRQEYHSINRPRTLP